MPLAPSPDSPTLFVPSQRRTSIAERATTGLPTDLLNRAANRLQILCWLYAFTFFMAAFLPALIIPKMRAMMLAHGWNWAPGVIAILVAVTVALAIRMTSLRPATVTALALVFEIVSCYGIAAAEFVQPMSLDFGHGFIGLSWVSVWMLLFNVVVPTVPRYAVFA